jgi:hypothetical protein
MTDEAQQHSEGPLLNPGCLMLLVVCGGLATMLYGLGVLVFGDTPASSAATVLLAGPAPTVLGVAVIKRFPDAAQMKGYAPSARVTRLAARRPDTFRATARRPRPRPGRRTRAARAVPAPNAGALARRRTSRPGATRPDLGCPEGT